MSTKIAATEKQLSFQLCTRLFCVWPRLSTLCTTGNSFFFLQVWSLSAQASCKTNTVRDISQGWEERFSCAVAHPSLLLSSIPCPLPLYQPELQWDLVSQRFCPTPQWLIKKPKKADSQNVMDLLHFLVQQSRLLSELFLGVQMQRGRNTPVFTSRL